MTGIGSEKVQSWLIVVVTVSRGEGYATTGMRGSIRERGIRGQLLGMVMMGSVTDVGIRVVWGLNEDLGRTAGNDRFSGMHIMRHFRNDRL